MDSAKPNMPGIVIWAQVIVMIAMGMVFALAIGAIFTDEPLSRFIGIGLIFGLSSVASVRKRHFPSLLIFAGGILWFPNVAVWDSAGWMPFLGGALVVAGLIVWFLGSHRGSGAAADTSAGERVTGTSVEETAEDEIRFNGTAASAKRIVTSQAFRGGEVSVSLGALEIDFTSARLAEDGASLSLASQVGNIILRVPGDRVVEINGSFKFWNVKDDRSTQPTEGPQLRLNVNTTMGGVQITD